MADTDYNESASEGEFGGGTKQRRSLAGRKLMRWNPDVDQYVLLAVDIACNEIGAPVPWDVVAAKINPTLTGEGLKQHLAKVRKFREQNGRPVPHKGNRHPPAYGAGATTTPRRGKNPGLLVGKGAGLLWTDPKQKPAKETYVPIVPKQTEVKKKGERKQSALITPKNSRTTTAKATAEKVTTTQKSTGKRSCAKKDPVLEDGPVAVSPTSSQRNLRPQYHVNYDESQNVSGDIEDVLEARSPKQEEEDDDSYGDPIFGSQPNTVSRSGASSRSLQHGMRSPLPPPPNFDRMLHSRTGMHTYGAEFGHYNGESNFGGMMAGMRNESGNQNTSPGGYGKMAGQGHDGFSQSQYADDFVVPARRAMKQSAHREGSVGTATPVGKKTKKKNRDAISAAPKRTSRKDSDHGGELGGEQRAAADFNSDFDHFGKIPIANDTGRGYAQTMPNFSNTFTTYPPPPAPTMTASLTDLEKNNFMAGLPSMTYNTTTTANSTGITPQFNDFNFASGDHSTLGDGLIMPTTEAGHGSFDSFGTVNSFGGDGMRGVNNTQNSSFASSNDTSVAGSLSDQMLPSMHFGGHDDDAVGLGLGGPWASQGSDVVMSMDMRMEMEMGDEKAQDHDMFSLLNEGWH